MSTGLDRGDGGPIRGDGLHWFDGTTAASPLLSPQSVRGIPLLEGGLGYPGLPDKAILGAELQYFRMTPSDIL